VLYFELLKSFLTRHDTKRTTFPVRNY